MSSIKNYALVGPIVPTPNDELLWSIGGIIFLRRKQGYMEKFVLQHQFVQHVD
jgi:hypothetical protein